MKKRSKRFQEAAKQIDKTKAYPIAEAVELAKKNASAKFDETVEVNFKLNVDPRHADQMIRGAMVLPNGTGTEQTVAVVAEGDKAREAQEAGADFVGSDELIEKIQKEQWTGFDVLIATPNMMSKLGKLGRFLGPKGLMPNPKTGTVTMDVTKAVEDVKKGKVTYRTDREGNISLRIGKASFDDGALVENFEAIYDVVQKARPVKVKGTYMKNVTLSTSMGPGIKIDIK